MKKIIILTALFFLMFSYGCEKFLDVNHDPDQTEESTVQLVLPAAQTGTSQVLGGNILMLGQIWSQQWSAVNFYHNEETFSVAAGQYAYDIGTWRSLYSGALMDFEWVKTTAFQDSNWTYYLIATAMQCYTYQVLADLWEDIPITEALKGVDPHYDYGSDVYDILIENLDLALSKDLNAESCQKPGEDDLIFGGDMDDWIAFANTLKLKIYLRESDARPSVAEAGIKDIIDNNKPILDKDAVYDIFSDEDGRDNFMNAMEFRGGNISMRGSKTIIDFLKDKNDPRIDFIFVKSKYSATHEGLYQGDYLNVYTDYNVSTPELSRPRVFPTMPMYYFSKAQVLLMLAEIDLKYYGGANTQTYFEEAITADASRLNTLFADSIAAENLVEIDLADIIDAYQFPTSGTDEEKLESIIVQKWIACANIMAIEAFFEHNRTGYPRESVYKLTDEDFDENYVLGEWIQPPSSVLTPPILFPKRLVYSSTEMNRNQYAPTEVKSINEPIWWDYQK